MQDDAMFDELTGQEIKRFLGELTTLSGQAPAPRPVLELLLGDIFTSTSIEPEGQDLYLCVTGLLPPGVAPPCTTYALAALLAAALDEAERAGCELLWHADQGRCILVRKISLHTLADERSVMDAILDTADLAQRCLVEAGAA